MFKKENVNQTANTRSSTEAEKKALIEVLSTLPIPRKRYIKAALNTAVFCTFSFLAFCIIWFISDIIFSTFLNINIGISSLYAEYLFPTVIFAAITFSINSTRRWLNSTIDEYSLIKADIITQKTDVEKFQVIDAICFKEPEFGGRLYFLLLQSINPNKKRIRVVYDYESQNKNPAPQKVLIIKKQMTLYTAPISNYLFENSFEGDLIEGIEQYHLTLPPEQWPEPNSWKDIKWNTLKSIYNP